MRERQRRALKQIAHERAELKEKRNWVVQDCGHSPQTIVFSCASYWETMCPTCNRRNRYYHGY